ncbi:MAG: DUF523 domain-containing protein [Thermodesulfobacteriota bacterium]|nr:DUF523 domain-containing protein [Thermodesulfobacteriota bacterium]
MNAPEIPRVCISRCLLGQNVRYDGRHALAPWITREMGDLFKWVPICPEAECGLPIPREPMRLERDAHNPRLVGIKTRTNYLRQMLDWTESALVKLREKHVCAFILKSKSPSCAARKKILVYDPAGRAVGISLGIFARALEHAFPDLPVEDELRLKSAPVRQDFIKKVRRLLA